MDKGIVEKRNAEEAQICKERSKDGSEESRYFRLSTRVLWQLVKKDMQNEKQAEKDLGGRTKKK